MAELQRIVYSCQLELLNENIVDDDQGIYLMALLKNRNLIKEHLLGKNQWRTLFLRYDETFKLNIIQKFRKYLGIFKYRKSELSFI
ncbi:WlaTC/HtrL family glycosyltransferase [Acinetobacter baumannii]|nr:WlaTC/HtrL family glycosyltransferase [Acinetobacter baumannii]